MKKKIDDQGVGTDSNFFFKYLGQDVFSRHNWLIKPNNGNAEDAICSRT